MIARREILHNAQPLPYTGPDATRSNSPGRSSFFPPLIPTARRGFPENGMTELKRHVLLDGLRFPEGPRWHEQKLWFSDMFAHQVFRLGFDGESEVIAEFDDQPSGLGFLPDGSLLVVLMSGKQIIRVENGQHYLYADLSDVPGDYLNDMVVASQGRAYVDSSHRRRLHPGGFPDVPDTEDRGDCLVIVETDGSHRIGAKGVVGPNGLAITPDGSSLIVAETRAGRLTSFLIDKDGSLFGRKLYATTGQARPDGICLDNQGALWIGSPFTSEFLRILPGGEVSEVIERPGSWAVACMLGGTDRCTLFMLSADTSLERFARLDSNGRIEVISVDVPGAGWP